MTQLVIGLSQADAAAYAKREHLTGRWQAVTPDNYRDVLPRMAVPRVDAHFADITWVFQPAMLDAVSNCIRRGNAA